MRFDDLKSEGRRHARVKGIAAPFKDAHADSCRDPVRRRHDTKRARDFRPRCEDLVLIVGHGP
jgi:hypothetical protein